MTPQQSFLEQESYRMVLYSLLPVTRATLIMKGLVVAGREITVTDNMELAARAMRIPRF